MSMSALVRALGAAAGGVSKGMDNAVVTVPSFSSKFKSAISFVKFGSPANQFGDAIRSLANDKINDALVA